MERKKYRKSQRHWEAESGRITVHGQPRQIVQETPIFKIMNKMGWRHDSSDKNVCFASMKL
jgi:hypothetical protein